MWHVGMDWHSRQTSLTVRDSHGRKLYSRHVRGGVEAVVRELRKLKGPFSVTFEASTGYGHVYDEIAKVAHTVRVAHPGHLRLIFRSKRKSDRVDSDKMSKLDYLDEVPQVHVPRREVRSWRRTITYRTRMVMERTSTKCRIRAFLRSLGIAAPRGLWTKAGIAWLEGLEFEVELDAIVRDEFVERLGHLDALIRRVTKALDRKARANPAVQLLMTIPGVGPRTAEAVVAWVDDIKRFSSVRPGPSGPDVGRAPGRPEGRRLLRGRALPRPERERRPLRAHNARGTGGREAAPGRGDAPGRPAFAEGDGVLRARPP
jgi:transposase